MSRWTVGRFLALTASYGEQMRRASPEIALPIMDQIERAICAADEQYAKDTSEFYTLQMDFAPGDAFDRQAGRLEEIYLETKFPEPEKAPHPYVNLESAAA